MQDTPVKKPFSGGGRGHFVYVCEYGKVHTQCRCAAPNKTVRTIVCDILAHVREASVEGSK